MSGHSKFQSAHAPLHVLKAPGGESFNINIYIYIYDRICLLHVIASKAYTNTCILSLHFSNSADVFEIWAFTHTNAQVLQGHI